MFDSIIRDWWMFWNVRTHQQTIPKFCAKTNLIGPLFQKNETMQAAQNRRFYFDVYSSSPWAHHIGESAKAYGLKVRCLYMENMLGNTLWTWGTLWEPIRNLKRTSWEHIRKHGKLRKKIPYPPLTWALLLAKRKINLLLPPPWPPPIKICMESLMFTLWIVHFPHHIHLKKKPPVQPATSQL